MKENIISELTSKNDKYACALADKIISESRETDKWYEYFDDFATLLSHEKSLVRNSAFGVVQKRHKAVCRQNFYLSEVSRQRTRKIIDAGNRELFFRCGQVCP